MDITQMTQEEKGNTQERAAQHNVPERVVIELDMCSAVDRLAETLIALRLAFDTMQAAPNAVCILPDNVTWEKVLESRRQQVASILLVRGAVEAVETAGNEMVRAVNTLLNL